MIKQLDK
jgi:hypothetical protein